MNVSKLGKSILLGVLVSSASYGSEISLLNGFYKAQDNDSSYDSSEISLGGRYLTEFNSKLDIYGQGQVTSTSYSGTPKPDNLTSLELEVGVRKTLTAFSERILPYLSTGIGILNDKSVGIDGATLEHTKRSGIVYNGKVGVKVKLGQNYFLDLETALFNSNLMVTDKTGDVENKKTEIFASTGNSNIFDNAVVAIGYVL